MIEMLLVLLLLSLFLAGSKKTVRLFLYHDTQNRLIHKQTTALFHRKSISVNLDPKIERFSEVWFNAKGNVNTAQTLIFENGQKIVIGIGPGRIHE